ncbi:hypothetical protein MACK_001424 [Theileria orientalis]|uniref:Uncharacterized protein n=1 Tax=Theileria orientalis TaxID=68886 RepID=A0A976QTG1_THEOR|nr:hypothetical protein MACK_001424 [Theileria orientalis]
MNSRPNRKRITAKLARNNLKIDFFSNSTEPSGEDSTLDAEPVRRKSNSERQSINLKKLLRNKEEYERVREESEKFYSTLENYEGSPDFSEVVVMDQESLVNSSRLGDGNLDTLVPIATRKGVSSYGVILIKPNSVYGPLINTRGTMVIVFIEIENGMVFFESLNSIKKKRTRCKRRIQVLVIPDEAFVIHNESSDVTARLLAISCSKKWKNFDNLRFKEVVALE